MEAGAWIWTGLPPLKGQGSYFSSSAVQGEKDMEKREGKYPQNVLKSASLTFLNSVSDMSATIPGTLQVKMNVREPVEVNDFSVACYVRALQLLQQYK